MPSMSMEVKKMGKMEAYILKLPKGPECDKIDLNLPGIGRGDRDGNGLCKSGERKIRGP